MAHEHDKLASLLFPKGGGSELLNFKLLRTAGDPVPESFVRDEVHSALMQAWVTKRADTRSEFPRFTGARVNVADIVSRL